MRFGAEYRLHDSDVVGLIIFSAPDLVYATKYIDDLLFLWGFDTVSNLKPLLNGACIDELQRLFPGFLQVKRSEKKDEGKTT